MSAKSKRTKEPMPYHTNLESNPLPQVAEPLAFLGLGGERVGGAGKSLDSLQKISAIRRGLPYSAIEGLSEKMGAPVKSVLEVFGLPQTTYNKKKRDGDAMSAMETELLIYVNELMDYGLDVFNDERDKFLRWLHKPNLSLGGVTPHSLLDSITGVGEVRNCLSRIDYGNLA
jgi:putative toxin-antitoxin system antitoxin component (TIGR02293 family)